MMAQPSMVVVGCTVGVEDAFRRLRRPFLFCQPAKLLSKTVEGMAGAAGVRHYRVPSRCALECGEAVLRRRDREHVRAHVADAPVNTNLVTATPAGS